MTAVFQRCSSIHRQHCIAHGYCISSQIASCTRVHVVRRGRTAVFQPCSSIHRQHCIAHEHCTSYRERQLMHVLQNSCETFFSCSTPVLSSQDVCQVTTGSTPQTVRHQTSGLPPQEAPVMIAEKRKLFSSFLRDKTK
jgi:hypothetical protein